MSDDEVDTVIVYLGGSNKKKSSEVQIIQEALIDLDRKKSKVDAKTKRPRVVRPVSESSDSSGSSSETSSESSSSEEESSSDSEEESSSEESEEESEESEQEASDDE